MNTTCLFCPNPTVGEDFFSVEHIIPESMGGTLKSRDVCKPCNEYFGRRVDCLTDDPRVVILRREAGLNVEKRLPITYYHPRRQRMERGWQDRDGRIYPDAPFYRFGDLVDITGPTPREVEKQLAQTERGYRRTGRGFAAEPAELMETLDIDFRVQREGEPPERFQRLLGREGAKIAIEYIGRRCGADVARDPALAAVRDCARHDAELAHLKAGYYGHPIVWCPKFGRWVVLASPGPKAEMERLVAELEQVEGRPPGLPQVPPPIHTLGFSKTREGGRFFILLFDCLIAQVPVPESLPLPW
ncbi:MAG: HNH endonuclease [Gemmatimonadales bacterium]